MTRKFQAVLQGVRALSRPERQALYELLAHDLGQSHDLAGHTAAFWESASIDSLAERASVPALSDVRALALDVWPPDESADDVNAFVAERRRDDRREET